MAQQYGASQQQKEIKRECIYESSRNKKTNRVVLEDHDYGSIYALESIKRTCARAPSNNHSHLIKRCVTTKSMKKKTVDTHTPNPNDKMSNNNNGNH